MNNIIIDVTHILAENNAQIHTRLDYFMEQCKKYNVDEYYSYSYFNVGVVDGVDIDDLLNKEG